MSFLGMLPIIDAVIKKQVETADSAGGSSMTWATRLTSYSCRIYESMGMVKVTATGENVLVTHKLIGEYNSGIIEGDIIIKDNSYRIIQIDKVYGKSVIHHLEMKIKKENISFA